MKAPRPARAATGRPLLALAGLLACWIGARVAVWELPERPAVLGTPPARFIDLASTASAEGSSGEKEHATTAPIGTVRVALARVALADVRVRAHHPNGSGSEAPTTVPHVSLIQSPNSLNPPVLAARPGTAAPDPTASRFKQPGGATVPPDRWSADLWLAAREGGTTGISGNVPTYGASQAGAVVRYRLAPTSQHDPAAFVRVVQVIGRREGDLAAGVAARVLPGVPITAHLEARASRRGARVDIRPAAFVAAGIDDARLALRLSARGYAQAGYVGGPDATAFADGSIVVERQALRTDKLTVGAGGGLWAGAQRGASRLDLGPSASLRIPLGKGSARVALDYRFRLAGNAAPASGAALTLSAGF